MVLGDGIGGRPLVAKDRVQCYSSRIVKDRRKERMKENEKDQKRNKKQERNKKNRDSTAKLLQGHGGPTNEPNVGWTLTLCLSHTHTRSLTYSAAWTRRDEGGEGRKIIAPSRCNTWKERKKERKRGLLGIFVCVSFFCVALCVCVRVYSVLCRFVSLFINFERVHTHERMNECSRKTQMCLRWEVGGGTHPDTLY